MDIIKKLKEPLKISDVDFRIQSISQKGYATILAYKDARVDMNRLDDVCGTGWQKDYKTIDGNLYCGVGIKIENEWLWRWDVGTESFSDKEKGQASDAFKRACFNWGIGRELYNYPHILLKLNENEFKVEGGKAKQTYDLRLKEWIWSVDVDAEGNVKSLSAIDEKGAKRYNYTTTAKKPLTEVEASKALSSAKNLDELAKAWKETPTSLQPKLLSLKNKMKENLTPKQQ